MEDYKPNSHAYKEAQKEALSEKKVEKVILGTAKTKKKNEIRKLADVFISEDVGSVKSYILLDVLVPAVKKAISDIVTNGIDMILYGGSGRGKRKSDGPKESYGSYYDSQSSRKENNYLKARNGFDYDEIVFDTRGDAEAVLDAMNEIISSYGVVSVGDLYDLASVSTNNYAVNKYGWSDIEGCRAVRVRDGYILKLPKPYPLNK